MKTFTSIVAACLIFSSLAFADDAKKTDTPKTAKDTKSAIEVKLPGGGCLACHTETEDPLTVDWKNDVHAKAGIGCVMCHGGNPDTDDMDVAKDPKTGFKGAPKKTDIPALCGRCHSDATYMKKYAPLLPVDQLTKYWTSVHGQRIKAGDSNVAQCVSCHGAHGIRKVSDPLSPVYASNLPKMCSGCHADKKHMAPYHIPTDQYDEYLQSVHGKALLEKGDLRGAPACNDCHGSHGTVKPGAHMIANVCGSCHTQNADLFLKSPMADLLTKDPLNECLACHGKHKILHTADDMAGDKLNNVFTKVYKDNDKILLPEYFSRSIKRYKEELDRVTGIIQKAEQKGMDTTEADDFLQSARQSIIQARTALHSFSKPPVEAKFNEGYTSLKKAETSGENALHESLTRRIGLAVSTFLLTIVIIALAFKIRSLPPSE